MASRPTRPPRQPDGSIRRDRQWRLRNLLSLSLRNLTLRPAQTTYEDATPNHLLSPSKLGQSLSSSDLRRDLQRVSEDALAADSEPDLPTLANGRVTKGKGKGRTPQRPTLGRARRRSTLEWVNATPQRRQEKLESVTAERMADVFFSLHVEGVEEAVYVSEVVEQTMNPTFRHVDWSACWPGVTRLDHLTLRFWYKTAKMEHWGQLLDLSLNLKSLQYLAKSLDQCHHPLPQNAVIFHLADGVYTSFPSLFDFAKPQPTAPSSRALSGRTLPTASFDALLRLSKLDDSIQDALATRNKLAADLEALLEANNAALTERDRVPEAEDRLKTIEYAKKTVQKQLDKARQQQDEKRAALQTRRTLMATDLATRASQTSQLSSARPEIPSLRAAHTALTQTAIPAQRRRICEDLQNIYPLHPLPGHKPLAFTIRALHLPNATDLDAESADTIAAALGHVAHVVLLLSAYLAQPLPYPVDPRSSSSTIADPISLLKTNASVTQSYRTETALRTYPLFSRGVPRFRFEYGVFLLGKDVQILMEAGFGVRVLDLRQTLPNLKYLLYLATATGEGELPARKAGGVRGLLGGRSGSQDSTGSGPGGLLSHGGKIGGVENGQWKGKGEGKAVDSLKRTMGGLDGKGKKKV